MKSLYLIAFLLISIYLSSVYCQVKYDIDNQGNSIRSDTDNEYDDYVDEEEATEPLQQTYRFDNKFFDKNLELWWIPNEYSAAVDDVLLANIPANYHSTINSFHGHKFYALVQGDHSIDVTPKAIIVDKNIRTYKFGPGSDSDYSTSIPNIDIIDGDFNIDPHTQAASGTKALHFNPPKPISETVKLLHQRSYAMSAKFKCLVPDGIDYYYDDGNTGSFQGSLPLGKETTTNTYQGHVFFFTRKGTKEEVARVTMDKNMYVYVIKDSFNQAPDNLLALDEKEQFFMKDYYEKNGILWRHYFGPDGPRPPPMLYMWPASSVGQVHEVTTSQGYWSCDGHASKCQAREQITLSLEVVSLEPRAFIINNFLSEFEVDEIIRHASRKLAESTVGNSDGGGARTSSTRTSTNAWVSRSESKITETLFLRASDLLQIDESLLRSTTNAEDMQVVHYEIGQKYEAHHDWGVSGYPESRFITLLLYLTDMPDPNAGGETAFPKGAGGAGFKIHPGKGNAVLFYNLLPDGNGDDLALHAALPVKHGEKWLANFWVWDPKRKN